MSRISPPPEHLDYLQEIGIDVRTPRGSGSPPAPHGAPALAAAAVPPLPRRRARVRAAGFLRDLNRWIVAIARTLRWRLAIFWGRKRASLFASFRRLLPSMLIGASALVAVRLLGQEATPPIGTSSTQSGDRPGTRAAGPRSRPKEAA
ncbi:MAG: hypothetical protein ABIT01_00210, partial [Thermoanaerobaculia bacterium]